uniref:ARAD1A12760p n=1 Tax=Blastobotrys adeninivorans TaxID=409370 RepID=A0A060SYJ3_BLAAD
MAPKKQNKMTLDEFMSNSEFGSAPTGSWADEEMPLPPPPPSDPTASSWLANKRDAPQGAPMGGRGGPGGPGGMFRESREPREPVPIPDRPPFTARVNNLDYNVTEDSVADLFKGFNHTSIRLPRDMSGRPRGVAFVEFSDRESLERALDLTGQDFMGRQLRVFVADPPANAVDDGKFDSDWRSNRRGPLPPLESRDNRDYDNWERRGPLPPRDGEHGGPRRPRREENDDRDYDNWERRGPLPPARGGDRPRRGGDRPFPPRDSPADNASSWRRGPDSGAPAARGPAERPKINLAPRTVSSESAGSASSTRSSSIFGGAKPVDTSKKLLEVEERQKKFEQEKLEAERLAREKQRQKEEERKLKDQEREEKLRKRFELLNTEGDEEEETSAPAATPDKEKERLAAKAAQEATEAERLQTQEVSKEELESEDWEVVGNKPRRR